MAFGVGGLGEDGHRGAGQAGRVLAGIGAAIDAVGGSFTMRYTTVAVTAARTGAASPAFTLSAPGGDAETVRRHGDFASAEPEDTCPPVRSSH